jgi:hypothetical protein
MGVPLTNLFATLDAPLAVAPSAWTGHFAHEEAAWGAAPVLHRLVIGPGRCLLTTEQGDEVEQVRCDAIAREDSLILLATGGGRYRLGTPLFKLCRDDGGIVTYWLGYAHAPAGPSRGRYFARRWS